MARGLHIYQRAPADDTSLNAKRGKNRLLGDAERRAILDAQSVPRER